MDHDCSAVPLPAPTVTALEKLFARVLYLGAGDTGVDRARALLGALFGHGEPLFGQVRRVTAHDLRAAAVQLGELTVPVTAPRDLAEVLASVGPDTPVCPMCGELPLANLGGRVALLAAPGARCPFCDLADVARVPPRTLAPPPAPPGAPYRTGDSPAAAPRVRLGGHTYLVEARLARGDGADVFLARRDARITERVVLKVARALADADLLRREWTILQALHASTAAGHDHFARLLPQPVVSDVLRLDDGHARPVNAYRWRSGFIHTLRDVAREHPAGVDPRTGVWLWKRVLELLGWIHRSGYVHAAVLPAHVLVHPRDQGAVLVGFSCAVRAGALPRAPERVPALSAAHREYYPADVWDRRAPSPATDLTMAARCIAAVLGGEPYPTTVPRALADLVRTYAAEGHDPARTDDAWELITRLDRVAHAALGPAGYHPLRMPCWT